MQKLLLLIEEHQYKISPREEMGSLEALEHHSWHRAHLLGKALGQELFPTHLQGAIIQEPNNIVPVPAAP